MASQKYTYSIAGDTLNGIVNVDSLQNEIAASTIPIAFDYANTAGDVLDLWFKAGLTQAQQTTLAAVVAAHAGAATEEGMIMRGHSFLATLDADTYGDVSFSEFRRLSGASAKIKNQTFGDRVAFEVWHPQGTEPLAVYGETLPVPADGVIEWGTIADREEGRADIPAGIILRATYHSVGTQGAQPEVCLFYRTHLG